MHARRLSRRAARVCSRSMGATPSVIGTEDRRLTGIAWILMSGLTLSVMDGLIKWSVGVFPVAEVVFVRSAFVLLFLGVLLARNGAYRMVKTKRPFGHFLRVALTIASILTFFESVRLLPLATAIAIGFGAPLFMTALSV